MDLDPRTPVLVGASAVTQHHDDPAEALEAIDLMGEALATAGPATLVASAGLIAVPDGSWSYPDPALLAERCGATGATTLLAEIGVTQQAVIGEVCALVAGGQLDVGAVVGGEARYRALRARLAGVDAPEVPQPEGAVPDRRMQPDSLGLHDLELQRNAVQPATAYALIEHARMARLGRTPDELGVVVGELYSAFAAVASTNPMAWDPTPYSAAEVVTSDEANRVISWPYTKRMCSQWNVDQAAALVICSVDAAERAGVPRDQWVFPWSSAVSDHAVPVIQRDTIDASPGAELAGAAALDLAGVGIDDVAHLDLYSCFPSAVQCCADALGAGVGRTLTLTGGMSFAGGPLNNYVLQAMVALVGRLRSDSGSIGLSSSVSTFLHKQGFGVWSSEPPANGFRAGDLSAMAAAAPVRAVVADHVGAARVASWTVEHQAGLPFRAVVVCDVGGGRTLASTGDRDTCVAMTSGNWIGLDVDVRPDGSFRLV